MENIWMVRAGEKAILIDKFISANRVAIGWNDIGDLTAVDDLIEIKKLLTSSYPFAKKNQISNYAGQIYRFRFDFKIADHVITYDPSFRRYHIGKITSNYQYASINDYHHGRTVQWFHEIERDRLSTKTKNSLGSVMSVFKVSALATAELNSFVISINK